MSNFKTVVVLTVPLYMCVCVWGGGNVKLQNCGYVDCPTVYLWGGISNFKTVVVLTVQLCICGGGGWQTSKLWLC